MWKTRRNNGIVMTGPTGGTHDLRVVWDTSTGLDVAYVTPVSDDDKGNIAARLVSAAPLLLEVVRRAASGEDVTAEATRMADLLDGIPRLDDMWRKGRPDLTKLRPRG
jgi:hypothetical protein